MFAGCVRINFLKPREVFLKYKFPNLYMNLLNCLVMFVRCQGQSMPMQAGFITLFFRIQAFHCSHHEEFSRCETKQKSIKIAVLCCAVLCCVCVCVCVRVRVRVCDLKTMVLWRT